MGDALRALREGLRDERGRLTALALGVLLVLGGVARSYMELALSSAQGRFPMPGDNAVMLASCAVVCFLVVCGPRRAGGMLGGTAGRTVVCALALVSTALLAIACLVPDVLFPHALSAAGVLARVASLLGLIVLCATARPSGVWACAAQMALGLLLAVALDLVFLVLAPVGVAIAGLLLPVALWALLARIAREGAGRACGSRETLPGEALDPGDAAGAREAGESAPGLGGSGGGPDGDNREEGRARSALAGLGVVLVTFALYGLVGGLASSQAFSVGMAGGGGAGAIGFSLVRDCLINDAGLLLGSCALLAGVRWLAARGSGPLALRCVLLPAYLVAIFLTPLMAGYVALLIPLLMAFSQGLFYGLLWLFPQAVAGSPEGAAGAHAAIPARRLAAVLGAFFAGTYAGMWFGGDLLPRLGSGDLYMIAAAVVLGLVLALELLPRLAPSPAAGQPSAQAAPSPEPATRAEMARDAVAAGERGSERLADLATLAWGLTPRERAVLPGLARGRSIAWVAASLTLSRNTVHTHVRNIYQKAGVHSQQELIDAVESLAESPASAVGAPRGDGGGNS